MRERSSSACTRPVGLDIGAITPEEIAVAITAEMIAVRRHADLGVRSMRYAGKTEAENLYFEIRVICKVCGPDDSPRLTTLYYFTNYQLPITN